MSTTVNETVRVKTILRSECPRSGLEIEKEITIEVLANFTTYSSEEYHGEYGHKTHTTAEVEEWELGPDQELTDEEYLEYQDLDVHAVQELLNEAS